MGESGSGDCNKTWHAEGTTTTKKCIRSGIQQLATSISLLALQLIMQLMEGFCIPHTRAR